MSNIYFYVLIALLAGAMMTTQAATNNKMAAFVNGPPLAAFLSFLVGTVALLLYAVLSRIPLGNLMGAKDAPAVAWLGGLLGVFFVMAALILVPKFGVAMTFSFMIAGQMIATLVIDHFGLLGIEVRPVSWTRITGILLISGGVALIRKF